MCLALHRWSFCRKTNKWVIHSSSGMQAQIVQWTESWWCPKEFSRRMKFTWVWRKPHLLNIHYIPPCIKIKCKNEIEMKRSLLGCNKFPEWIWGTLAGPCCSASTLNSHPRNLQKPIASLFVSDTATVMTLLTSWIIRHWLSTTQYDGHQFMHRQLKPFFILPNHLRVKPSRNNPITLVPLQCSARDLSHTT